MMTHPIRSLTVSPESEQKPSSSEPLPQAEAAHSTPALLRLVASRDAASVSTGVNLKKQRIDPSVLALVPENLARRHRVVPIHAEGDRLAVAMADPEDLQAIDDLHAHCGLHIIPVPVAEAEILEAIDLYYKVTGEITRELQQFAPAEREAAAIAPEVVTRTPIVRTVDLMLSQAIKDRASDIHIEPQASRLRIRFRIDGILHEVFSLPTSTHAPLVSRLKIMAGMNIAERRLPQDGQLSLSSDGREVDMRAATTDTIYGEMMVLRILDKSASIRNLSDLGFLPEILGRYNRMLKSSHGMILVCGPTGSGKTTTLYASVSQMDHSERNVITIEDPVEYRFPDVNSIQVNPKAGLTFAVGLRSIMRLDPDVILVGEIRDSETARIAVQAALTGHLVLSSIHANDAVGSLSRLINLGIEPFLVASALVGVLSQRMVRRVCPHCRTRGPVPADQAVTYANTLHETLEEAVSGAGCQFDMGTGYLGRTGIFELLAMSEDVRKLVTAGASGGETAAQAARDGTVPMLKDGMLKAKMGMTTISEVLRTVYSAT
ncbi:MAG: GspE/PulE family protein [Dehalococcoidia bacterium]|nr:GspE/PulE family protein [Dehalococcoidia bacterium]